MTEPDVVYLKVICRDPRHKKSRIIRRLPVPLAGGRPNGFPDGAQVKVEDDEWSVTAPGYRASGDWHGDRLSMWCIACGPEASRVDLSADRLRAIKDETIARGGWTVELATLKRHMLDH